MQKIPSTHADPLATLLAQGEVLPTRLGDKVLARLSGAIADGRLKPGDAIPSEASIAAAFGVSKQIAREAIRELAAMGVIHVQQGKTSRVRAVNGAPLGRFFRLAVGDGVEGLVQAVELRRILEPGIAQLAAARRGDEDVAALRAILARMQASFGDVSAWIEGDLDFHRAVAKMSGNRLIELQLEALEPVIRRMMERFNQRNRRTLEDWRQTWARHDKVFRAIEKGRARQAFLAMSAHFDAAATAISEVSGRPEFSNS